MFARNSDSGVYLGKTVWIVVQAGVMCGVGAKRAYHTVTLQLVFSGGILLVAFLTQIRVRVGRLARTIFGLSRKGDFFGDPGDVTNAERRVRRLTGCMLSAVILVLVLIALCLNAYEGYGRVMVPLALVACCCLASIMWLLMDTSAVFGPVLLLVSTLALLGVHLLLVSGVPNGYSLFWFLIFPGMIVFGLGGQRGGLFFGIFYLFLLLILATPLHFLLAAPLPGAARYRFLAAMFGAFAFAWGTDFIRCKVQLALGRTMQRLEQDSMTDPLTGLGNRRDFENFFSWAVASSPVREQFYTLAIIDLDYFKRVNDAHGHEVGDRVLRHFAQVMNAPIRFSDRLFRWGGEEFLLLMPRTSIKNARAAAERLRSGVEETPYIEDGISISVTVSIGLCEGFGRASLTQALDNADQNLYAAKTGGRNVVVG